MKYIPRKPLYPMNMSSICANITITLKCLPSVKLLQSIQPNALGGKRQVSV